MNRGLLLGHIPRDLACAFALGVVEDPRVVATLESVTVYDDRLRPLGKLPNWLLGDDPLDVATREYLRAKRDATMTTVPRPGQTAWGFASAARARDGANDRARKARDVGRGLLAERGVLTQARQAGLKLIAVD
jgi:hypothetical protein